jgi:hypothetical protein
MSIFLLADPMGSVEEEANPLIHAGTFYYIPPYANEMRVE